MSSHPGCTLSDAVELAEFLNKTGRQPEQVQDFYPTPGTLSTCMWYTEIDPRTMKPVYVAKDPHDKALQRALLQWKRPEMRRLVTEALHRAHRTDLIGYGKECLIRPLHSGREEDGRPGKTSGGETARRDKTGQRPGSRSSVKTAAQRREERTESRKPGSHGPGTGASFARGSSRGAAVRTGKSAGAPGRGSTGKRPSSPSEWGGRSSGKAGTAGRRNRGR